MCGHNHFQDTFVLIPVQRRVWIHSLSKHLVPPIQNSEKMSQTLGFRNCFLKPFFSNYMRSWNCFLNPNLIFSKHCKCSSLQGILNGIHQSDYPEDQICLSGVQERIYQIYKNPHPNIIVLTVGAGDITIVGSKLPNLEIENMMRKDDDYSRNHRVESYKFIWLQMNMRLRGISIESQIHQMVEQRSVGLWNGRWKTVKIRLKVQEIYFSICIRSFVIARNCHALLIELYKIKRSYPWVNNIFFIF